MKVEGVEEGRGVALGRMRGVRSAEEAFLKAVRSSSGDGAGLLEGHVMV